MLRLGELLDHLPRLNGLDVMTVKESAYLLSFDTAVVKAEESRHLDWDLLIHSLIVCSILVWAFIRGLLWLLIGVFVLGRLGNGVNFLLVACLFEIVICVLNWSLESITAVEDYDLVSSFFILLWLGVGLSVLLLLIIFLILLAIGQPADSRIALMISSVYIIAHFFLILGWLVDLLALGRLHLPWHQLVFVPELQSLYFLLHHINQHRLLRVLLFTDWQSRPQILIFSF